MDRMFFGILLLLCLTSCRTTAHVPRREINEPSSNNQPDNFSIAANENTPVKTLIKMAHDGDIYVKCALARNPSSNNEVLAILLREPTWELLWAIKENANISKELAAQLPLSYDKEKEAQRIGASQIVLNVLAKDISFYTRQAVAANIATKPDLLVLLSEDPEPEVQQATIANAGFPVDLLSKLAKDPQWHIRQSVALNPSTPPAVLSAIANDEYWGVREAVAKNPATPHKILRSFIKETERYLLEAVASNTSVSLDILQELKRNNKDDWDISRKLVANPNASPELLNSLLYINDPFVKINIATNKNTSPKTLEILAQEAQSDLAKAVAGNAKTPSKTLDYLSKHYDDEVRKTVAAHPNISAETLTLLSRDRYMVRLEVAKNIKTSRNILERFREDSHAEVQKVALQRLK